MKRKYRILENILITFKVEKNWCILYLLKVGQLWSEVYENFMYNLPKLFLVKFDQSLRLKNTRRIFMRGSIILLIYEKFLKIMRESYRNLRGICKK